MCRTSLQSFGFTLPFLQISLTKIVHVDKFLQFPNRFSWFKFCSCFLFCFEFCPFTKSSCVAQKHKKTGFRTKATKSNIFNSSQVSGLLNWVRKLRAKDGPLSPKQYTGIVRKARTEQELLDVVHDFEDQIGKVNGIFLAAAAAHSSKH